MPLPVLDLGEPVTLSGGRAGPLQPFELTAHGVDSPEGVRIDRVVPGAPLRLSWQARAGGHRIEVFLSLADIPSTGEMATIECSVPDSGAFEIPAASIDAAWAYGTGGFGFVLLSRRSAVSTASADDCVELSVVSEAYFDLEVEGVQSCMFDHECPAGKICPSFMACVECVEDGALCANDEQCCSGRCVKDETLTQRSLCQ